MTTVTLAIVGLDVQLLPHPSVLAVGINVPSPGSHANLRAISGPGEFFTTDFILVALPVVPVTG